MIEEIKKEISTVLKPYKDCHISHCFPKIFEILDKYNNQSDYKSAWNELKNKTNEELEQATWASVGLNDTKISMQELEQKYKLGGE